MLTSCKLTGDPAKVSAYHTKEENYYFSQAGGVEALEGDGGAQPHVRVYGKLARRLSLTPGQTITEEAFTNLLSGKAANGAQVTRKHKVNGIDLTFSAPKSVSVAGLLTIRDPKIIEAHDRAVLETMAEIERHCAVTRPTAETRVETGNLAYVVARDGFNRDHDPHLHSHVVVMNMTALGDGVLALDGRQIMRRDFNKMWGAMYRAKLAAHLKDLGYSVSYTKKGELRMDAVSLEVEREFSGRRAQIAAAKARGERDMEAWRKTRKEKDPAVLKGNVVAEWRQRLARHESRTAEENRRAAVRARDAWYREATWSVEAKQELAGARVGTELARWQLAARRATEGEACVTPQALIAEYLAELGRSETWNYVTYPQAEQRLRAQVEAGNLLRTDDGLYTTWELARADRECVVDDRRTVSLRLERGAAKRDVDAFVKRSLEQQGRGLSTVQAEAAAAILASPAGLVAVQGDAGAGKTTMLKAVREAALAAGWDVAGVATAGLAARTLDRESGIASTTLASYLSAERARGGQARRPRLLVVDESSTLGSRDLSELVRFAEQAGDKVVLVGDRNQLQSIGAGKPFERLVAAAEASGQLVSLCENWRQRSPVLQKAVELAKKGGMRGSLEVLDEAGKLEEIEDAYLRRLAIAKLYDKDTLLMTGTKQGRDALNKLIRERLVEQGRIDAATERRYAVAWKDQDGVRRRDSLALAVGDRVTFLDSEYKRYDVRNGEVADVVATEKKTLTLRLEDGRQVALDLSYYSAIGYGYALTTYKSQGQTFNKVVVDADTRFAALQDERNCYVQITRARDDIRIFTDDRAELLDLAGILSTKRDTLELDHSLSEAAAMERRLSAAARAQAGGKVTEAEAFAAHAAARLAKEYGMEQEKDEPTTSRGEGGSRELPQPAPSGPIPQADDPVRSSEAYRSPHSQTGRESSRPSSFPFDPSVTANIRNFKALFGDEELSGSAEILRIELRNELAAGRTKEAAVERRLADLDATTAELVKGAAIFIQAPEKVRKMALASLTREVERRMMLTGEQPAEEVRSAYEALQASLEPAIAAVRVRNDALLETAGGVARVEKALRAEMKEVEDCVNGRAHLEPADKERLAAFLSLPEAEDLLLAKARPELRVRGAEVALGLRTIDDASSGLDKADTRALTNCVDLAANVLNAKVERGPELDKSTDFGLERD